MLCSAFAPRTVHRVPCPRALRYADDKLSGASQMHMAWSQHRSPPLASSVMLPVPELVHLPPRTRAPTPLQESVNAASMLAVPVALAPFAYATSAASCAAWVVVAASAMQAACSAAYHASCALQPEGVRIGTFWHRMDQTGNHVACAASACAVVGNNRVYCACAVCFNAAFAARLWRPQSDASTGPKVYAPLAAASLLYMLPLAWRCGSLCWLGTAATIWLTVATCFLASPLLHGWTHAISHLLCVPLGMLVVRVAAGLC